MADFCPQGEAASRRTQMAITASMVAELRAKTDAPMMECKKALTEAEGDMAKAEELLRVKLGTKAGKAASRVTAEGVVASFINGNLGALIEVNSETDFVSKNDSFIAMANAAAKLVAEHNPADIEALGALAYEQDSFGPTLEDVRKGLIGKIGENMSFRRFKRFSGSNLAAYLHGSRIGVVVEFDGDAAAAKDVAMHVAAMKPVALTSADVPADLIAKERSVAEGKADEANKELVAAGKPAQSAEITAKRIDGAVQKYLKEVSLADQVFVKAADGKQTVAQMLKAANTNVKGFTLYVVGEGIEKKVDDFAAEAPDRPLAAPVAALNKTTGRKARCLVCNRHRRLHAPRYTCRLNFVFLLPESCPMPAYKRILLKLSGEALMGDDAFGINRATIVRMVEEIADVTRLGVQVAIVIGGGNIFRGVAGGSVGMDRATADYMGMLATVMNSLALADTMDKAGLVARVMSAIAIEQ
eukprot:gene16150-33885_t